MIRPLRRAHRAAMLLLAVALPALLLAAVLLRAAPPAQRPWPLAVMR